MANLWLKIRPYLVSLKHFGVSNTIYQYNARQRYKKLNQGGPAEIFAAYVADFEARFGKKPEIVYTDDGGFKPDFAPETLEGGFYFGPQVAIRSSAFAGREGSVFDIVLQLVDEGVGVLHIPVAMELSANGDYIVLSESNWSEESDISAIKAHLARNGEFARVSRIEDTRRYSLSFEKQGSPMVSILIPNKDNSDMLKRCVDSIIKNTIYSNFEIVIIENNSTEDATFKMYEQLQEMDKRIRVITCITNWNYSYINNYGVKETRGEYLVFLNNDTEVISMTWLDDLLAYGMRKGIGAVGARLFFEDATIQHAGVIVGIRGVAGHCFSGAGPKEKGYMDRIVSVQNLSAVTAACMLVKKSIFEEVGGFDEKLAVAFNDVDLCMKIRRAGYRIVYNPSVCLTHYESKSRGSDEMSPEKLARFNRESWLFQKRWRREIIDGDPYYNRNLSLLSDNFETSIGELK